MYCAQKPRRESASQVDEFFESGTSIVNPFDTVKTYNHNPHQTSPTTMEHPSYHPFHLNYNNSYNNNTNRKRPCRVNSPMHQPHHQQQHHHQDERVNSPMHQQHHHHQEALFPKTTSMNFPVGDLMGESPDLPGLFDSITPPYHSPAVCIKNEKILQDPCSYPPASPEFASLLDVSQPEQVIVKREPTNGLLDTNKQCHGLLDTKQCQQQQYPGDPVARMPPYMGHFAMSRLHMMPLTPPSSEPGSDSVDSVTVRTTPPPPYMCTSPNSVMSSTDHLREDQFGKTPYSRRNNPELEKRRTHRCIFPGKH